MSEKKEEIVEKKEEKEVELRDVEIAVKDSPEEIIFKEALKGLNLKLKGTEINVSTIMTVVKITMETVELTKVKGEKQKDLAVKLIKKIVKDAPISDEKEKLLLDMLEEDVIGSTIDLVVAASRGQIKINHVKEVAMSCWQFIKSKLGL